MNRSPLLKDPLFTASKFVAINPPTRYRRIYTTICSLILLSLAYGVVLFFKAIESELSALVTFSLWLQLLGQTMIVLTDFLTVLIWPENFLPPTEGLKNIEATLKGFGFVVDDKALITRLGVLQVLLSFGVPIGFGFLDLIGIIKGQNFPHLTIYFAHYVYALTVINVTELSFVNYLCAIERRFKELNRIIAEVHCSIAANRNVILKKIDDERISNELHVARKAHYDLTGTAEKVNKSYGLHLLLSMTFSVILITEQLYQNYEAIAWHGRTVLESLYTNYTWTGYHMTRVTLIILACNSTSAEAGKTASLVHAIPMRKGSQKFKDEIFHFSLQIQERLRFTAAGFFGIDLTVFTSVTSAVVTYLLIMIQMQGVNRAKNNTP